MKEYKIDHFQDLNKRSKKSKRPKTKGFGYQVLGFGAGGGVSRDPYDIEFLIVAGGGGARATNGGGGGGGA